MRAAGRERDARLGICAMSPLSLIAMRSTMRKTDGELLALTGMRFSRSIFGPVIPIQGKSSPRQAESFLIDDLAVFVLLNPHRSGAALVAEMKPHAWAEVHGYAGTMVVS
jgi:hypothetical protein